MNRQHKEKGFTIIEVVLVLAIAGLIFLMVFIALPALQRGQRDNGRKNDVSTVASAINSYASNNRGDTTTMTSAKLQSYIDKLGQYANTDVTVQSTQPGTLGKNAIIVVVGMKCNQTPAPAALNGNDLTVPTSALQSGTKRGAAVLAALENDGSKYQLYCQDV